MLIHRTHEKMTASFCSYQCLQKRKRRRRRGEVGACEDTDDKIRSCHPSVISTLLRPIVAAMSISIPSLVRLFVISVICQLKTLNVSAYQLSPLMRTGLTSTPTIVVARPLHRLYGWKETNGEWEWIEDDPNYVPPMINQPTMTIESSSSNIASVTTTPKLPSGTYKPKQSLGQNYLRDPNTVAKIIRAFHSDATTLYNANGKKKKDGTIAMEDVDYIVELGPGAGALTDPLIAKYGIDTLHCIEIDVRSIELLRNKHPQLHIEHLDVLQINYNTILQRRRSRQQQKLQSSTTTTSIESHHHREMEANVPNPIQKGYDHDPDALTVIGNLPYYITSQILFALVDATHQGLVRSATITMQYEVGQRMFAHTCTKEYGILSVVFQIYCTTIVHHFKIPPTVFYPQPKVNSILLGLHFVTPYQLQQERLCGVYPSQLRRVITVTFQQRRKTIRNSIKSLLQEIYENNTTQIDYILNLPPLPVPVAIEALAKGGNAFAIQQSLLPNDWSTKRPEEIHPSQFIELTRLIYSGIPNDQNNYTTLNMDGDDDDDDDEVDFDIEQRNRNMLGTKVWRKLKHGG